MLSQVKETPINQSNHSLQQGEIVKEQKRKITLDIDQQELKVSEEKYKQKLIDMQRLMEKLSPDGAMNPQMQRNYYSARKLPIYRKSQKLVPSYWVCNLCGCQHSNPNECAQPELGGVWHYKPITITHKAFEYIDD